MTNPVDERVMELMLEEVANQRPAESEANSLLVDYFLGLLPERDRDLVKRCFGIGCPMDEAVQPGDIDPILPRMRRERETLVAVKPFVVRLVEIIQDAKRELSVDDFSTFVAIGAAEVR